MQFIYNPSNAKASFVQSTRIHIFLKTILTLSCWYPLNSSHWVLSNEYPWVRVSDIFHLFCIILYCQNSPQQHKGWYKAKYWQSPHGRPLSDFTIEGIYPIGAWRLHFDRNGQLILYLKNIWREIVKPNRESNIYMNVSGIDCPLFPLKKTYFYLQNIPRFSWYAQL